MLPVTKPQSPLERRVLLMWIFQDRKLSGPVNRSNDVVVVMVFMLREGCLTLSL